MPYCHRCFKWICIPIFISWLIGTLAAQPTLPNPILFVTQLPIPDEWMTISQTFGNHIGRPNQAGRGGDLWIRYPDGTLRNLTEEAGYGQSGFQGNASIAVRDPNVYWDGTKAVFSMVIGAPEQRYRYEDYYWQLYEITGLGQNDTPVITPVPNQPADFNNISPAYAPDDRIIFCSDRPRNGARHLYPQLDEYESAPTVTGIWSLDPASGDLRMLNHSPSGSFRPFVDSYGRVIYTRWDHLQRDQQNGGGGGAFNWSDESAGATNTGSAEEIFPEPRETVGNVNGHRFESFFPWQINPDGTEEEVINHIGRHELISYFTRSFTDDPNLDDFYGPSTNRLEHMFQIREDPTTPGDYFAIDSPTFYHHAAGRIIRLDGAPDANPEAMRISYVTADGYAGGHYRNPLPLSDGTLIAAYTRHSGTVNNLGSREFPRSPFRFRLHTLSGNGGPLGADQPLTPGIRKPVQFYDPDVLVSYADSVDLWEFDPVEVVARPRPALRSGTVEAPEQQIFSEENISVDDLRDFLVRNELALVVSRNVTTRDRADLQQPYNLRVTGTSTETLGAGGRVYDISHMQFFQGDQIRGYANYPSQGRRILAQPMHDGLQINVPNPGGPAGSVRIGNDGSMAAFVPASRALTWQSTGDAGDAVVRERYWVTFQAGEIRVCAGCHGVNTVDQAGNPPAANAPEALRELMQHYKSLTGIADDVPGNLPTTVLGNYPNPFNPATTIVYALPEQAAVELTVYNLLGESVTTLVKGTQSAGRHEVRWQPGELSSGIYLYQLQVGAQRYSGKMILMK